MTAVATLLLVGCVGPGPAAPTPTNQRTATSVPSLTPTSTPSSSAAARPRPSPSQSSSSRQSSSPSDTNAPATTAPATNLPQVGRSAWVAVSVATLWRSPNAPRVVDRPALANPARIRAWLSALTVPLRRDLNGRADTQALLGDRVVVTARSGSWAKVVVPDQPTPLDARGYPGWVPVAQLTGSAPLAATRTAAVITPTAWLRSDDGAGRPIVEISFGTRLPVVTATPADVRVAAPPGRVTRIAANDVSLTRTGTAALAGDGVGLVRTATTFTDLPYLWAGTSGFGFDCSGLTWLTLRVHGITIARDASPQSTHGRLVPTSALRPGDLLFFANASGVHHVGIYAGVGRMVHAPGSGRGVETVSLSTPPYSDELVRARRYLE